MITPATLSPEQLDESIATMATAAPHLVAVLRAMKQHGIAFAAIEPTTKAFWPQPELQRPAVVALVDDEPNDPGPVGFHVRSLRQLFRECGSVAINGAEPHPMVYAAIADEAASERRHAVVIETASERVDLWTDVALAAGKRPDQITRCRVRDTATAYETLDAGDLPPEPGPAARA